MPRSLPEWIGKSPDSKVPDRVRLRVFDKYDGTCYLSGLKIKPCDKWDIDHINALITGGENRECNLAPALRSFHKKKTATEMKVKEKIARTRKRHIGIKKPSTMGNSRFKRKMDGTVVDRETGESVR